MPRQAVALALSDIHMRATTPRARHPEPSWEAVTARHLNAVRDRAADLGVPVFAAGDLFHRWDTSPRVINFALTTLPPLYGVAGQHDMPHHREADLKESAYWTCVLGGVVQHLDEPTAIEVQGHELVLYPYGWGSPCVPLKRKKSDTRLHIAIIHASIYQTKEHQGVQENQIVQGWTGVLKGYDFAIFGDNHGGFLTRVGGCQVVNCGGMIPTNRDQRNTPTGYAVLYSDGTAEREWFDHSQDLWAPEYRNTLDPDTSRSAAMRSIVSALADFSEMDLDYPATVRETMDVMGPALRPGARRYTLSVLSEEIPQ